MLVDRARRVLAVQPHYDDNDIAAGGTLAALRDAGAEIHYLTVTDDLLGVLDGDVSDAEARARLRAEQEVAGAAIGVSGHYWLDYPDAGDWSQHELRQEVIRHVRMLRPDFLFTVDPWLPTEAHGDHLKTGRAVAEAALLQRLPRVRTDPEVDRDYEPYDLAGVAFYFTSAPNTIFDVSATRARKERAVGAYAAQFTPDALADLQKLLEGAERRFAEGSGFSHGEPLRVLAPSQLHCAVKLPGSGPS